MPKRFIGLSPEERNFLVLAAGGAKREAACLLGWEASRRRGWDSSYFDFVEREIERIRERISARPRTLPAACKKEEEMKDIEKPHSSFEAGIEAAIEGRIAELDEKLKPWIPLFEERERLERVLRLFRAEEPDRLDEREAQPLPPDEEKLDEREERLPPTPSAPPLREDQPEDEKGDVSLETIRDWVVKNFRDGGEFQSKDVRERFGLSRSRVLPRLNALIERGIIVRRGTRAVARYRYNDGPRPGENESPTRHGSNGHGLLNAEGMGDLATNGRGRTVEGTGKRVRSGSVGRVAR